MRAFFVLSLFFAGCWFGLPLLYATVGMFWTVIIILYFTCVR